MKKFGFATIAASASAGFAAAIVGLAAPAQAVFVAETPATSDVSLSVPAGVDHLDWLNDIQPKVNVPQVDTTVRHSGGSR